ncbi:hypothetical protein BC940DRAFT_12924 [Gongronella butleri]|nr:hypothetical protein BC940DRAFT_12924 [Gongronella butleri]
MPKQKKIYAICEYCNEFSATSAYSLQQHLGACIVRHFQRQVEATSDVPVDISGENAAHGDICMEEARPLCSHGPPHVYNKDQVLRDPVDLSILQRYALRLYNLASEHRISDNTLQLILRMMSDMQAELRPGTEREDATVHSVKALLERQFPATPVEFDMCVQGCEMFTDADAERCSRCSQPRWDSKDNARRQTKQLSVMDLLAVQVANAKMRSRMQYRHNRTPAPDSMDDIFDGTAYKQLVSEKKLFNSVNDIALGLFIDGFISPAQATHHLTLVQLCNFNLHPKERYRGRYWERNMIQ